MGYPPTRPKVVEYLSKHVGEHVFLGDIAKATKLSDDQVQSAMNNIRSAHTRGELDFPIEIIQRGQIWCYRPSANKPTEAVAKRMFEELGVTKAGELIIQDAEGTLYKAQEL